MWMIYQLSQEKEKLLLQYIDKMIKEGKIWLFSSSVGRPIFLFLNQMEKD